MTGQPLPDRVVEHLRGLADWPDLSATRYDLVDRVGRGGMGTVWLCLDRELEREVAVKVLTAPDPGADETARLLREARILARLEHPGIVPVHDAGRLPDGRPYYVMKYVRGRRLDEHLREVPSLLERLRLFLQICDAVSFAHAHDVIHRDLKPQNVMIGPFGEVLVLDWGVAKVRGMRDPAPGEVEAPPSSDEVVTERGTVLGTRGYMSPEQAAGEVDLIDRRTDVFALGMLLHVMLEGQAGASLRSLRAIAARASGARREERYQRVEDLAAEIRRAADGDPVEAYRENVLEATARLARKYRTPLVLVVAYLIVRVVLILVG